jgi:hypothetical protein
MTTLNLKDSEIAIVWSIADVLLECDWLTEDQAYEVLHALKHRHDGTIGINWDTIYYTGVAMYPQGEDA